MLINKKIDCTLKGKELHSEGRHVILQVEINGEDYIIGNIYCPTNSKEREVYYKELTQTLQHIGVDENSSIILGGDWNTIQKNIDRQSTKTHVLGDEKSLNNLNNMITQFDLCDIWRVRNPQTKRYTYRTKKLLYQSRLDYWMISNSIQDIITVTDIISSLYSDHSAIILGAKLLKNDNRGKGYWKFNSSLLKQRSLYDFSMTLYGTFKDETNGMEKSL